MADKMRFQEKKRKTLGILMPAACSTQETSAFLRTKLTHQAVSKHSNSNQQQQQPIIHCACSAEYAGGGGSHGEGKLRDGGVLTVCMTPALQRLKQCAHRRQKRGPVSFLN